MAEVSVIVPVYKAVSCLDRCVESVVGQTYRDFELILIDDGSPDCSGTICDIWAEKDDRIKVVHRENGGVSAARNTGLENASGEYVLFVDSDDWIYPEYIQKLMDAKADLTACGLDIYHEKGWHINTIQQKALSYASREQIDFAGLYGSFVLYSPYCKLFRREIIEKNNIRFPTGVSWGEDGMFVADYMAHVHTVRLLEYVGYRYLKYAGEGNLSTKVRPDIIDTVCRSREYCIASVERSAPWAAQQTREICQEDILCNCAGFVTMLIKSKGMRRGRKKRLLAEFMKNPYVQRTFQCPEKYYDPLIVPYIRKKNPVDAYLSEQRREKIRKSVLASYEATPKWTKRLYRWMKGKK